MCCTAADAPARGRAHHPDRRRPHRRGRGRPAAARRLLAMPALANAHDHARVTSTRAYGRRLGKPLETWLPYLALLPSVDPYLAAAVSLARSALGGAGVGHGALHARPGADRSADRGGRGRARRRATSACGSAFAVAMRDRNPLVYGPSEPMLAALSPQRARGDPTALPPPAASGRRDRSRWSTRCADGGGRSDVRRAIRPAGGAMVHARAAGGDRARPRRAPAGASTCICWRRATSAPGRDAQLSRAASSAISTRSACSSPRLTLAHCTWARPGRTGTDRRARRDHLGQHQLEPASAFRHRAARRDGQARLPRRARPRRLDARRGRRRAARDAARASAAQRHRLRHRRRPRRRCCAWRSSNGRLSVTNKDDGGALAPGEPADILLLDWDAVDRRAPAGRISIRCDLLFARSHARVTSTS